MSWISPLSCCGNPIYVLTNDCPLYQVRCRHSLQWERLALERCTSDRLHFDVPSCKLLQSRYRKLDTFTRPEAIHYVRLKRMQVCINATRNYISDFMPLLANRLRDATVFNQDLCSWNVYPFQGGTSNYFAFSGTACPNPSNVANLYPDMTASPPGPFCHVCQSPN